jgi:hypothetical protein
MTSGESAYLIMAVAAFVAFGLALAWTAATTNRK